MERKSRAEAVEPVLRLRRCGCGCGRKFPVNPRYPDRKYLDDACRARAWRKERVRVIRNDRPRSERAYQGTEFQLSRDHLRMLDAYKEASGFEDRSEALRSLLDLIDAETTLLSRNDLARSGGRRKK